MKDVIGITLIVCALTLSCESEAREPKVPEKVLQQYAEGYVRGDVGHLANVFARYADHNGDDAEAMFYGFHRMVREGHQRLVQFRDVVINQDRITAWVVVKGRVECGGPLDIRLDDHNYIVSMRFGCTPEGLKAAGGLDGAVTGQVADVASTAVGMSAGFAEANPIVAGAGLPLAALAKFGLAKHAENLETQDCHKLKNGLATAGWGLTGWNICTIATANPLCAIAGVFAAKTAHEETRLTNLMICRASQEGEKYSLIDHTGVYR